MDKLEDEMSQMRQRIEEISDQLCVLHDDVLQRNLPVFHPEIAAAAAAASPQISPQTPSFELPGLDRVPSLDSRLGTYAASSSSPSSSSSSSGTSVGAPSSSSLAVATPTLTDDSVYGPSHFQQPPANDIDDMTSLLDALSEHRNRVLVDCRCGVEHKSPTECLEYSTFLILLLTHENLSRCSYSTPPRLPRNPSLLSLFRHSYTSNPIIHILGSIFNRIHPVNVYTMFGIFLGMYRFLRVGLFCHFFPPFVLSFFLTPGTVASLSSRSITRRYPRLAPTNTHPKVHPAPRVHRFPALAGPARLSDHPPGRRRPSFGQSVHSISAIPMAREPEFLLDDPARGDFPEPRLCRRVEQV